MKICDPIVLCHTASVNPYAQSTPRMVMSAMVFWSRIRQTATVVIAIVCGVATGCAGTQTTDSKIDDPQNLKRRVVNFHRYLRWEKFHRAAQTIEPGFRHTFMGRYEEYGDDVDIVNVKVQKVAPLSDGRRRVDVEQRWMVEPDMTVDEDEFVEVWTSTKKGWMLEDRMKREEWERRQNSDDESSDGGPKTPRGSKADRTQPEGASEAAP